MALGQDLILETRTLVKAFKGFVAVDGVSLRVRRGGGDALIGPKRGGEKTFFHFLTQVLPPTAGAIFSRRQGNYPGKDRGNAPPRGGRVFPNFCGFPPP